MTHKPAEVLHPSEYIKDEMKARGWTIADLAARMSGNYGVNYLALELYFEIGPSEPNMRIEADQLARAFGTSPQFFLNLEAAWLAKEDQT